LVCLNQKKTENVMDVLVKAIYGDPPPPKRANVSEAIGLAEEMLLGKVSNESISRIAHELYDGPMPYSTHDLALSAVLNFIKNPDYTENLREAQLMARLSMLEWLQEGKVAPLLVKSFEDTLYKMYKK
jgi:hypothetical protein